MGSAAEETPAAVIPPTGNPNEHWTGRLMHLPVLFCLLHIPSSQTWPPAHGLKRGPTTVSPAPRGVEGPSSHKIPCPIEVHTQYDVRSKLSISAMQYRKGEQMRVHIIKHNTSDNFGYVEAGQQVPANFYIWATLDTQDWTLNFADGQILKYNSFREIHQDVGEIMLKSSGEHRLVRRGPDESSEDDEPITDLAEQWDEMGVLVEQEIAERDSITAQARHVR